MPDIKDLIERIQFELLDWDNVTPLPDEGPTRTYVSVGDLKTLLFALTRSEKENAELREALRPFAAAWEEIEGIYAKHGVSSDPSDEVLVRSWQFTHGEYRRARAVTKESIDPKG